jgi:hypothetical protein
MAIDTPARLAVIGAGPIGLEAALYARYLGYDVVVYERGEVAEAVRQRGHVPLFAPFSDNASSLGLAAIQAQDEGYQPPAADALLTGDQWIASYLLPLAQTDLVADHLRLQTEVLAIGKEEMLKGDLPGHEDRGDWSFRVLARDAAGRESVELFDGVLDCSGVLANPNWLGHGGLPALGERALREQIEYGLPDVACRSRDRYAGRHTLVVGGGISAASNVVALAELAGSHPGTRVTWVTRREGPASRSGPLDIAVADPWPARAALVEQAGALAAGGGPVEYRPQTVVEALARGGAGQPWVVQLGGRHAGNLTVDEVIANVGYRPDHALYRELQVAIDPASDAPLTPALVSVPSGPGASAPAASSTGPPTACEPNFYVLGHKSFGRRSDFHVAAGLAQIRRVFAILGDRETLDLYASARRLLR